MRTPPQLANQKESESLWRVQSDTIQANLLLRFGYVLADEELALGDQLEAPRVSKTW